MRLEGKRGQTATETLMLVGFALIFITPIILLFMASSNSELGKTSIAQAKITTRTIADEAGELYLQGAGAKKSILVNFPQGTRELVIDPFGLVSIRIDADGRKQQVVSQTFATLKENRIAKNVSGLMTIDLECVADAASGKDMVNIKYR